jgi:hypothetical protein
MEKETNRCKQQERREIRKNVRKEGRKNERRITSISHMKLLLSHNV